MVQKIKLRSVVLDCIQPSKLAKFYSDLLGGKTTYEIEHFVSVSIPGETITISCQLDEDYTPPECRVRGKNRRKWSTLILLLRIWKNLCSMHCH